MHSPLTLPAGLPKGSSVHAMAHTSFVRLVLNTPMEIGKGFAAFSEFDYLSTPWKWEHFPEFVMKPERLPTFADDFAQYLLLAAQCEAVA